MLGQPGPQAVLGGPVLTVLQLARAFQPSPPVSCILISVASAAPPFYHPCSCLALWHPPSPPVSPRMQSLPSHLCNKHLGAWQCETWQGHDDGKTWQDLARKGGLPSAACLGHPLPSLNN